MRAGTLRHRLTLQTPRLSPTADGSQVLDWEDVRTVWGRVEPLKMSESVLAEQMAARASHRITLRSLSDLAPTARLVLETGRVFEVTSIRNLDERNRTLEVLVLEKVAGDGHH